MKFTMMVNPAERSWTVITNDGERAGSLTFYSERRAIEYIESMRRAERLPEEQEDTEE